MRSRFNHMLDSWVRPQLPLHRAQVSSYHFCGVLGLLLAMIQSAIIVNRLGLSLLVLTGITVVSVATFLALVMATKIVTGEEAIIYYHHEIAVLGATALFLRAVSQPVLPYLDVTLLGIGLFLAFGRIGCLMVGCCHGRPSRWGVRYRSEHARAGFPECYVGVRLFPVQGVESLLVFATVVIGTVALLGSRHPGQALVWYTVMYGVGRFWLEFLRGDVGRPYHLGFSEAQWISTALGGLLLCSAWRGTLTFSVWQAGVIATLPAAMVVVALWRSWRGVMIHRLMQASHLQELAETIVVAFDRDRPPARVPRVESTSLGLQISAAMLRKPDCRIFHYAMSARRTTLNARAARALARHILQLRHSPSVTSELVPSDHGVFHLIVRAARRAAA